MIMQGLQNMTNDSAELMELIEVLTPRIEACQETLTIQRITFVIQGLQHIRRSNHPVVLKLIKVLLPKLESCPKPLKSQHIKTSIETLKIIDSAQ